MRYSIVYSSKTGNTALLAESIKSALPTEQCTYCGDVKAAQSNTDIIFVGFWTDKGSCSDDIKVFLQELQGKKVFLFGTAGFGGSTTYYERILTTVKENLDSSNILIGTYLCQGKMPLPVKQRYEAILAEKPNDTMALEMLTNFDRSSAHPNQEDMDELTTKCKSILNNSIK